jgi:uncharacterized membrane protein
MHVSDLHYLPLTPSFFSLLVALFVFLVVLVQVGALQYAYARIGVSSRTALLLLLGSLIGSYVNIPVAQLPEQHVATGKEVIFFAMHYVVPVVVDWPGTVVALNLGGAIIAGMVSLYLVVRNKLWVQGLVTTACVAAVCHWLAHPVPGLGIAVPILVPSLAAALAAILFSRWHAAPLAYISGSLGTLIGADLLNLGEIPGLGAPVASIGGAGTFDGIFLTGILAVLIASLTPIRGDARAHSKSAETSSRR